MDLKNYIADVISQTIEGVQIAQKRFNPGARVLPPVIAPVYHDTAKADSIFIDGVLRRASTLHFDIEVVAERQDARKTGAAFSLSVAGFGAKTDSARRDNATNRISFQIVIVLPEVESE